jgi:hypothetical protein
VKRAALAAHEVRRFYQPAFERRFGARTADIASDGGDEPSLPPHDRGHGNLQIVAERPYISADSKFSRYCGRPPEGLDMEDVRAFQVHVVSTGI